MKKEIVKFSDKISWQYLDDKIFVIDEITENVTIFKGVSAEIWSIISCSEFGVCEVEKLIVKLSSTFNTENIISRIESMIKKKLLIRIGDKCD